MMDEKMLDVQTPLPVLVSFFSGTHQPVQWFTEIKRMIGYNRMTIEEETAYNILQPN
jgi:hypothetical protein